MAWRLVLHMVWMILKNWMVLKNEARQSLIFVSYYQWVILFLISTQRCSAWRVSNKLRRLRLDKPVWLSNTLSKAAILL